MLPPVPSDDLIDNALGHFVAVAEHGSFSSAAKTLGVRQPSLSVAVRKLEERIGARLLHRGARGVKPTRAGTLLLERARQAQTLLAAGLDEIAALDKEPRGRFRLGCHESLGTYALPGFMARFLVAYPDIELSLFNANSLEVEEHIVSRDVDLGLVVNPTLHPDTVVRPLFDDAVCLVIARKLRRQLPSDPFEALSAATLLHVPALRQTQSLLETIANRGHRPARQLACSSMALVRSLVLDGTGIGVLPYRVAIHGVAGGRIEVLSPELPKFDDRVALVWRADSPMTAGLRALVDGLREHAKQLAPLPEALR